MVSLKRKHSPERSLSLPPETEVRILPMSKFQAQDGCGEEVRCKYTGGESSEHEPDLRTENISSNHKKKSKSESDFEKLS